MKWKILFRKNSFNGFSYLFDGFSVENMDFERLFEREITLNDLRVRDSSLNFSSIKVIQS